MFNNGFYNAFLLLKKMKEVKVAPDKNNDFNGTRILNRKY